MSWFWFAIASHALWLWYLARVERRLNRQIRQTEARYWETTEQLTERLKWVMRHQKATGEALEQLRLVVFSHRTEPPPKPQAH